MKDCDGKRKFELGPIVTMSCHPWDSNAKNKTHQIPPQQDSPVPHMPANKPRSNPLQAQVAPHEPSQHNEPRIPGPSPSSKPHEDVLTCEPEPEVALTQSTEDPFARPTTPHSVIIIDNTPIGSPPPHSPSQTTPPSPCVTPHSDDDTCQEFTDLRLTLMIP
ncbi:hypothetical protein O181_074656 [Austropuccinia psidii MF-1]|uniref:Uncharacterized protein n=1 Tax=Austropuccinia psidii MF-1 TaxID=1389203 RepID=A0A9Q3I9F2_9BASI|nr:hypothetical protein [Austropuccinia psidii MF-1]